MKLRIVTNTNEQCGNYQYAVHLIKELRKHFEDVGVYDSHETMPDVMIWNWHPAVVSTSAERVKQVKAQGVKTVLILQNSHDMPVAVGPDDILAVSDVVIAHEPMCSNVRIEYIPHGIPDDVNLQTSWVRAVGTAGFLFPWKRPDVVVEAARRAGVPARIVCPPYGNLIDPDKLMASMGPGDIEYWSGFLPEDKVIQILSGNALNIFWFESRGMDDRLGQTGSARMGFASQRPVIISRHRKFRTIIEEFDDEVYIADSEREVYQFTNEILENLDRAKRPKRMIEQQGWSKVGEMYANIIRSL